MNIVASMYGKRQESTGETVDFREVGKEIKNELKLLL